MILEPKPSLSLKEYDTYKKVSVSSLNNNVSSDSGKQKMRIRLNAQNISTSVMKNENSIVI